MGTTTQGSLIAASTRMSSCRGTAAKEQPSDVSDGDPSPKEIVSRAWRRPTAARPMNLVRVVGTRS